MGSYFYGYVINVRLNNESYMNKINRKTSRDDIYRIDKQHWVYDEPNSDIISRRKTGMFFDKVKHNHTFLYVSLLYLFNIWIIILFLFFNI